MFSLAKKPTTAPEGEVDAQAWVPYSSHVTSNSVKLADGDYLFSVRLTGASHESADIADINGWHEQLHGLLRNIASPQVGLWSHIVRREQGAYPGGDFEPGSFAAQLNDRYRSRMQERVGLVNELYLTVIYRPTATKVGGWFARFASVSESDARQQQAEDLERIDDLISTVLTGLDRYDPQLLGCYQRAGAQFSEVLEFLAYLANGFWQRFPVPRGPIGASLMSVRPFFGKGGNLALQGPSGARYGGVVTIQEYPAATAPGLLNGLLGMPCELIVTQSMTFLSKPAAQGSMTRQQRRLISAGDLAQSQVAEIGEALDDLIGNRIVLGAHSFHVTVLGDSPKAVNEFVSIAGSALADAGMKWVRETGAAMDAAYWSTLPGNFAHRVRVAQVTSRNFAGLSAFHNYPTGRADGNQWGPAVAAFRTVSGAPYYFNFHKGETGPGARTAKLDPNHRDLANTVVIGKSGTGKTVLELFLLAQLAKFHRPDLGKPLTAVVFDKDLGAAVGVRAMGGLYYPLKLGVPSGFNPLQLPDTPGNRAFLGKLISRLVQHEGMPLSPAQEREIDQAIKGVMGLPHELRRMSSVLQFLDPTGDAGVHARLQRWCEGGALGWLFDNQTDTLQVDGSPVVGFDVTEFLEHDEVRTPLILYLFHRIEALIDGRRIPIFMDEFWKLLGDPAFEDLIQNKLVTIRKQDGFLVMFTQSPAQVLRSPVSYAVIGQTATKIFLPNPEASREDYVEGFKLSHREWEIVRSLPEKSRQFLVKQGENSVVCELNLRGLDDELAVLSGNTATSALAERLVAQHGTDPAVWLPLFHQQRKGI